MSLQFVIGGSGSGKSQYVFRDIIKRASHEKKNFLVIVPDQFTMQSQMELCTNEENDREGIMNIDVLSFSRLSHRVMEELGVKKGVMLDDTGKNLILRKVAGEKKDELSVIGANLSKLGYIHEIKSMLSEFYQYAIGEKELDALIDFSKGRALEYKLRDLKLIKDAFDAYVKDQYITTEGLIDQLCELIPNSEIVAGSVVVLDGFTGFTPVQYHLLKMLMRYSSEMIITLQGDTIEAFADCKEQDLFALSAMTYQKLRRIAKEEQAEVKQDVILPKELYVRRYENQPELGFLEQALFRNTNAKWTEETTHISLTSAANVRAEATFVMRQIKKQIMNGYQYRDIAIISGVSNRYAHILAAEARRYGIPLYMDQTRGILSNPLSEFLRSMLAVLESDFYSPSVIRFLKCGILPFERKQLDAFERYLNRFQMSGFDKYDRAFTGKGSFSLEGLSGINETRAKLVGLLTPVYKATKKSVQELVKAIYDVFVACELQKEMQARSDAFLEKGDGSRAKEYAQVYGAVVDLLDQIYALLPEEPISISEFAKIVDAGLSEITIGTIPQNVDQVVVGDIERTRLSGVKILFFVGVNDGAVPSGAKGGGLLSDMDRAFLKGCGLELAPTPREQIYRQRLYLYMNMTKPTERLYVSYALVDEKGASLRKSYLISVLQNMYPQIQKIGEQENSLLDEIYTTQDAKLALAVRSRAFASGEFDAEDKKEQREELFALLKAYQKAGLEQTANKLTDAAFYCYHPETIPEGLAKALYGEMVSASVSRLEKFAACGYAHFLRYGIGLEQEQEFKADKSDVGNLYHEVMQLFSEFVKQNGYHFGSFPIEEANRFVDNAVEQLAKTYEDALFYQTNRSRADVEVMKQVVKRSIASMRYQLSKGMFEPKRFEMPFLIGDGITVKGRIDRIDTYEKDGQVYVKVVDYKSSERKFDPVKLYLGLDLQLAIYLKAATETLQKEQTEKEVVPSAIVYYQFQNPYVEGSKESVDKVEEAILEKMHMTGLVRDDMEIIRMMDKDFDKKSTVMNVGVKKDGSFTSASIVASKEQFSLVKEYTDHLLKETEEKIYAGEIEINPYGGKRGSCAYCAYRAVCHFEENMPGFGYRDEESMTEEEAWEAMEKCVPKDES